MIALQLFWIVMARHLSCGGAAGMGCNGLSAALHAIRMHSRMARRWPGGQATWRSRSRHVSRPRAIRGQGRPAFRSLIALRPSFMPTARPLSLGHETQPSCIVEWRSTLSDAPPTGSTSGRGRGTRVIFNMRPIPSPSPSLPVRHAGPESTAAEMSRDVRLFCE